MLTLKVGIYEQAHSFTAISLALKGQGPGTKGWGCFTSTTPVLDLLFDYGPGEFSLLSYGISRGNKALY